MKDGYNSASRYILNQFKDAYRQLAIDILSGQPIADDLNALTAMISGNARDEVWYLSTIVICQGQWT